MQLIAKTLEGQFDRFERTACSPLARCGPPACWLPCSPAGVRRPPGSMLAASCAQKTAPHQGGYRPLQRAAQGPPGRARRSHRGDRLHCRRHGGRSLLLGRNGSDYSASLLAALADGESTTIWSDVAGVYSADPRRVKEARLLERLSLAEANELARLGSSVLHSRTLQPVADSRQRLTLRCSYNPDEGCTHPAPCARPAVPASSPRWIR